MNNKRKRADRSLDDMLSFVAGTSTVDDMNAVDNGT